MRILLAIALFALPGCKEKVSKEQEICAKAAAMFDTCEELDLGSGSDAALTKELMLDRWRGLCRAALTGQTAQMMPNTKQLWDALDEGERLGLKVQAECTAKATSCDEYAKCDD